MSIADTIKETVRGAMIAHPGATNKEVAAILGYSEKTVGKYARMIKSEWKGDKA